MNQVEHTLLAALWEVLLYVNLTDGLAQHAAHGTYGTLPARTVLLNTAHHLAQLEGYGTEIIAQHTGSTCDNLDFGVCLQIIQRCLGKHLLHFVDWLRLTHADFLEGRETGCQEHVTPVDARIVGNQLIVSHLVIVLVDVAQLHLAVASLGDAGLDGHHCLHLLLCGGLVVAHHLEELLHVSLVSLTNLLGLVVVVHVVVANTQSDAALTHLNDVVGCITKVCIYADAKHHGTLATEVELSGNQLILTAVLDGCDAVESWLNRRPSLLVQANAVHAEVVERTDLLAQRTLLLWLGSILQDDVLNALLVLLIEVGEGTVVGMLGIQRIVLHPVACGIAIEISSWLDAQVHVGLVDARAQLFLLGESCCCAEQQSCE